MQTQVVWLGFLFLCGLIIILTWTFVVIRWINSGYGRDEVAKMIETDDLIRTCPYCGGIDHTWGAMSSNGNTLKFTSLRSNKQRRIIANRCNHCGHVAPFVIIEKTNPRSLLPPKDQ